MTLSRVRLDPIETVRELRGYTATLATVFGECVVEYREMGKAADGHATDSRALKEAWPL